MEIRIESLKVKERGERWLEKWGKCDKVPKHSSWRLRQPWTGIQTWLPACCDSCIDLTINLTILNYEMRIIIFPASPGSLCRLNERSL